MRSLCILLTPRALANLSSAQKSEIESVYPGIKFVPCKDIYWNMTGGWTEAQCDDVAYIVDEEEFKLRSSFLQSE